METTLEQSLSEKGLRIPKSLLIQSGITLQCNVKPTALFRNTRKYREEASDDTETLRERELGNETVTIIPLKHKKTSFKAKIGGRFPNLKPNTHESGFPVCVKEEISLFSANGQSDESEAKYESLDHASETPEKDLSNHASERDKQEYPNNRVVYFEQMGRQRHKNLPEEDVHLFTNDGEIKGHEIDRCLPYHTPELNTVSLGAERRTKLARERASFGRRFAQTPEIKDEGTPRLTEHEVPDTRCITAGPFAAQHGNILEQRKPSANPLCPTAPSARMSGGRCEAKRVKHEILLEQDQWTPGFGPNRERESQKTDDELGDRTDQHRSSASETVYFPRDNVYLTKGHSDVSVYPVRLYRNVHASEHRSSAPCLRSVLEEKRRPTLQETPNSFVPRVKQSQQKDVLTNSVSQTTKGQRKRSKQDCGASVCSLQHNNKETGPSSYFALDTGAMYEGIAVNTERQTITTDERADFEQESAVLKNDENTNSSFNPGRQRSGGEGDKSGKHSNKQNKRNVQTRGSAARLSSRSVQQQSEFMQETGGSVPQNGRYLFPEQNLTLHPENSQRRAQRSGLSLQTDMSTPLLENHFLPLNSRSTQTVDESLQRTSHCTLKEVVDQNDYFELKNGLFVLRHGQPVLRNSGRSQQNVHQRGENNVPNLQQNGYSCVENGQPGWQNVCFDENDGHFATNPKPFEQSDHAGQTAQKAWRTVAQNTESVKQNYGHPLSTTKNVVSAKVRPNTNARKRQFSKHLCTQEDYSRNLKDVVFKECLQCHVTFSTVWELEQHLMEHIKRPCLYNVSEGGTAGYVHTDAGFSNITSSDCRMGGLYGVNNAVQNFPKAFPEVFPMDTENNLLGPSCDPSLHIYAGQPKLMKKQDSVFTHGPSVTKRPSEMNNHTSPVACSHCSQQFDSTVQLKAHTQQAHCTDEKVVCWVCSKTCSSTDDFADHFLRVHACAPPYRCISCKKVFSSSFTFEAHVRTHAESRRNSLPWEMKTGNLEGKTGLIKTIKHQLKKFDKAQLKAEKPSQTGRCNETKLVAGKRGTLSGAKITRQSQKSGHSTDKKKAEFLDKTKTNQETAQKKDVSDELATQRIVTPRAVRETARSCNKEGAEKSGYEAKKNDAGFRSSCAAQSDSRKNEVATLKGLTAIDTKGFTAQEEHVERLGKQSIERNMERLQKIEAGPTFVSESSTKHQRPYSMGKKGAAGSLESFKTANYIPSRVIMFHHERGHSRKANEGGKIPTCVDKNTNKVWTCHDQTGSVQLPHSKDEHTIQNSSLAKDSSSSNFSLAQQVTDKPDSSQARVYLCVKCLSEFSSPCEYLAHIKSHIEAKTAQFAPQTNSALPQQSAVKSADSLQTEGGHKLEATTEDKTASSSFGQGEMKSDEIEVIEVSSDEEVTDRQTKLKTTSLKHMKGMSTVEPSSVENSGLSVFRANLRIRLERQKHKADDTSTGDGNMQEVSKDISLTKPDALETGSFRPVRFVETKYNATNCQNLPETASLSNVQRDNDSKRNNHSPASVKHNKPLSTMEKHDSQPSDSKKNNNHPFDLKNGRLACEVDQKARDKQMLKCLVCGAVFKHAKMLETHIVSHFQPRFTCPVCPAKFRLKVRLHAHMKLLGHARPGFIWCSI